jgi:phosphohistidine phosphatase
MTSRRLYLLRHAKSSWDDPSLPDEQRPLAPRGRRAAGALERHFRKTRLHVDLVLCSPAQRTRETWAGVRAGVNTDAEVRFEPAVYAASAAELLDVVRGVDEAVQSLLVVAHNPGIEDLASELAGSGRPAALARLRDGFVTGGFATLSVESIWAKLAWGSGYLDGFVRPRDLPRG